MPILPSIAGVTGGFSWIKQHPVTATVAAAAAAAISIAQFAYDEQQVERKKFINNLADDEDIDRCISWSDEHGGELTEIIENKVSRESAALNTSASEESCVKKKSEERDENFERTIIDSVSSETSPSDTGGNESDYTDNDQDTEDSEVEFQTKSPVSPQWGWYVSITPPQTTMYQQSRSNTPSPPLVSH